MASAGDDAKILRDLFEGTRVMSALDHTKIEGANDPQMVAAEAEADQVARRAAEALRRSRLACQVRQISAQLMASLINFLASAPTCHLCLGYC